MNSPKIGVIAKIKDKLELPNGKIRIVLEGISRARVYEFLNTNKDDCILRVNHKWTCSLMIPEDNDLLVKKICRRYRELC